MYKNFLYFHYILIGCLFFLLSCDSPPPHSANPYRPKEKVAKTHSEKDFIVDVETKSLGKGENVFKFSIRHKEIPNPKIDAVIVTVGRPTTNVFDRSFTAKKISDYDYMVIFDLRDKWEWEVRVSFIFEDNTYSYKYTYYIY
ncbi:MAG: hypothetical protein SNJ53_03430 [Thermodesulfovibrionales bacterium]